MAFCQLSCSQIYLRTHFFFPKNIRLVCVPQSPRAATRRRFFRGDFHFRSKKKKREKKGRKRLNKEKKNQSFFDSKTYLNDIPKNVWWKMSNYWILFTFDCCLRVITPDFVLHFKRWYTYKGLFFTLTILRA